MADQINTSNIEAILLKMSSKLDKMSQAMFRMAEDAAEHSNTYMRDNTRVRKGRSRRNDYVDFEDHSRNPALQVGKRIRSAVGDFLDEFEYQVTDALVVSKFKQTLGNTLNSLADSLGVEISDLPQVLAKRAAKQSAERFVKNSRIGRWVSEKSDTAATRLNTKFNNRVKDRAIQDIAAQYDSIRNRLNQYGVADEADLKVLGLSQTQYKGMSIDDINRRLNMQQAAAIRKLSDMFESSDISKDLESIIQDTTKTATAASNSVVDSQNAIHASSIAHDVSRIKDILNESSTSSAPDDVNRQNSNIVNDVVKGVSKASNSGVNSLAATETSESMSELANVTGELSEQTLKASIAAAQTQAAMETASEAASALTAAGTGLGIVFSVLKEGFAEAIAELPKLIKSITNAAFASENAKERLAEAAAKRMKDDIETLIKEPFTIMKAAAESVYSAWDNTIRKINATQGYTKSDLQDLMATFADRIRSEGLTDVVAGTSVIENLSKVLDSGLSGLIAEEFAYQATLLNAAIPTQDFFGYASTYSSIAANAIKDGRSQSEAVALANASLSEFANNLLYASRELAGGYTTGLTNAQALYEQAVKITQAAGYGDISEISGVLTSVAATVGAIAPDLANSITDAVYKAATGGNDATTVALRSLAGVNASNTEFLRAIANDPQSVFSNLFTNLAAMFTDSSDAYMEKAEGYAELFGLSAEAFQRIDFEYLAQAVEKMDTDSSALEDNMKLLASGQTTLSQEQMKTREINKYMIDEGLTYVLDNEAARSIQEHMWDEQLAHEIEQNTFKVDLVGEAKVMLSKLGTGLTKSLKIGIGAAIGAGVAALTVGTGGAALPIAAAIGGLVSKAGFSLKNSSDNTYDAEYIQDVLEKGRVGKGNESALYDLTTYGEDLGLTSKLYYMMPSRNNNVVSDLIPGISSLTNQNLAPTDASSPTSRYSWGTVSKSAAEAAAMLLANRSTDIYSDIASGLSNTSQQPLDAVASKLDQMLSEDYMSSYIKSGDYAGWAASAKSLGISDFNAALESVGYNISEVEDYFADKVTDEIASANQAAAEEQQKYYVEGLKFYQTFPNDYISPMFELLDSANTTLVKIQDILGVSGKDTVRALIQTTNVALDAANEKLSDIQIDTNILKALFSPGGQLFIVISTLTSIANDASAMRSTMNTTIINKLTESATSLSTMLSATNGISSKADSVNTKLNKLDNINTTNSYILTSNSKLDTINTTLKSVLGSKLDSLSTSMTSVGTAVTYSGVKSSTSGLESYLRAFSKYFIDHNVYTSAYNEQKFQRVQEEILKDKDAQQGEAINALADALTSNAVDLKDPAVQTNALLSQILRTLNAILQNETGSDDSPLNIVSKLLGTGRK